MCFTAELEIIIKEANLLLKQNLITEDELFSFKRKSYGFVVLLIKRNLSETMNEIAQRSLEVKIRRIKHPFFQRIDSWLNSRYAFTHNAPFYKGHTDSDYNKRYIFEINEYLKGLLHNLKLHFPR